MSERVSKSKHNVVHNYTHMKPLSVVVEFGKKIIIQRLRPEEKLSCVILAYVQWKEKKHTAKFHTHMSFLCLCVANAIYICIATKHVHSFSFI